MFANFTTTPESIVSVTPGFTVKDEVMVYGLQPIPRVVFAEMVPDIFVADDENVNEIVLVTLFSVIFVMGLLVFVPAHESELGVVASVKDVILLDPGKEQPELSIGPYMVGGLPVAMAHTG